MRSIARTLARGPLLPRLSRRQLLSTASLIALSACAGTAAPATTGGSVTSATPSTTSTIGSIVQTIANAIGGIENQLGLGSGDLAKVTSLVSQLGGIAAQFGSSGSGSGALLSEAMGVLNLITPFIPGGTLLTAIETAMGTAQSLLSGRRMAAAAPGAMTHEQAMGILREAAVGHLPR